MKGVEESPAPLPPPINTAAGAFTEEVMGSLADAATTTAAAADNAAPEVTADASSSQPRSYAAAAATATTNGRPVSPVIIADDDQSGATKKASSTPRGTKRALAMPEWEPWLSAHRVDDWASIMRPPPKVNNQHVVYASFKDAQTLPKAHDVIAAADAQFGHQLVAMDVFPASLQYALAFCLSKNADAAAAAGLHLGNDVVVPLVRRPQHQPTVEKLTVSGVDCTNPQLAARHLLAYFGCYGRVLDITGWHSDPHGHLARDDRHGCSDGEDPPGTSPTYCYDWRRRGDH